MTSPGHDAHPLAVARFPQQGSGYESWFVRAADPRGRRAIWLRYTVHRAPGRGPVGSLWLTAFSPGAAPVPLKQSFFDAAPQPGAAAGEYVRIAGAVIGRGHAEGALTTPGRAASWSFTFGADAEPALGLPAAAMYGWPVPRAKPVSLHPDTTLRGEVVLDGERIDVSGWRGCVGHNWGPEHTPQWVWLQTSGFAEDRAAWLDCALGRVRVGPVLSPWLGSGWLTLDGHRHRLGDARGLLATRVDVREDGCRVTLAGSGLRVQADVRAPRGASIAWRYSDPDGPGRHVVHCSVATLELRVTGPGPGDAVRVLRTDATTGYEHGGPRPADGVPRAPFPDP